MKVCLAVLVLFVASNAQDTPVTVTAEGGAVRLSVSLMLRPSVKLQAFTCDKTELSPGEFTTCTVTLNRQARSGGIVIRVILPAQLAGPAEVNIQQGATSSTFRITYPETSNNAASIPFITGGFCAGIQRYQQCSVELMRPSSS